MSNTIISRCRPAIVAFALATAVFATGCITEVDEFYAPDAEIERDGSLDAHLQAEPVRPEERADVAVDPFDGGFTAMSQQLADDIAAGQLTDREAALVAIITALDDDETIFGWAEPAMKAVRAARELPAVDAEEAQFVDPGAPVEHGAP